MINLKFQDLPFKDLMFSGLIIFVMSSIVANIYNPLLGFVYAISNVLSLTFLRWLYRNS